MNTEDLHQPINLGNPEEFTIKELANEVISICGSDSKFEYLQLPEDDPRQRKPDITRAQTMLDWTPTILLRDGLARTVDDFKNR